MTLLETQQAFGRILGVFLNAIYSRGYTVTFGEAWRPPETAELYAKQGKGIKNSLHCSRLAVDLNLFRGREYLTKTKDYKEIGELWESLGTKDISTSWGGHFTTGDANHFSIEWGGRR